MNMFEVYQKALLNDEVDINQFTQFIVLNDFESAYKLLSKIKQNTITFQEFKNAITEEPVDLNPKSNNFQEEQMSYKKVALEFATLLVSKEYKKAYKILTEEQQKEYTIELLEKNMKDMVSYFENPNNIRVNVKFVLEEGAMEEQYIYVPIEEDGNSEALSLEIIYIDNQGFISDIDWGHP